MKIFSIIFVLLAIVAIWIGFAVAPITGTETKVDEEYNNSYLSAVGEFDRIELVDRHFGNWNGMEVEGETLAVVYNSGDSVLISTKHYETVFYERYYDNVTYLFYLYVYDSVDHLREKISVVSGINEEFIYLNVTVTVSLDYVKEYSTYTTYPGSFACIIGNVFGIVFISIALVLWKWETR